MLCICQNLTNDRPWKHQSTPGPLDVSWRPQDMVKCLVVANSWTFCWEKQFFEIFLVISQTKDLLAGLLSLATWPFSLLWTLKSPGGSKHRRNIESFRNSFIPSTQFYCRGSQRVRWTSCLVFWSDKHCELYYNSVFPTKSYPNKLNLPLIKL